MELIKSLVMSTLYKMSFVERLNLLFRTKKATKEIERLDKAILGEDEDADEDISLAMEEEKFDEVVDDDDDEGIEVPVVRERALRRDTHVDFDVDNAPLPFDGARGKKEEEEYKSEEISYGSGELVCEWVHKVLTPFEKRMMERRKGILYSSGCAELILTDEQISGKAGDVEFTYKEAPCALNFTKDHRYEKGGAGEKVHVFFSYPTKYIRGENDSPLYPCECKGIVNESTMKLLSEYTSVEEKTSAVQTYLTLSGKQREHLKKLASRPVCKEEKVGDDVFVPVRDKATLEMMYRVGKNTYPSYIRSRVETLFNQFEGAHGIDKADILTQISYSLGIDTTSSRRVVRTYEEIMAILDKHIYGMKVLKEAIAEYIMLMQFSGSAYCSILLVGPPGVGKTSVCEAMAECWDIPLVHVDCTGIDAVALGGLVKSYGGAKPGKVLEGFYAIGTTDSLLRLDELDKMQKSAQNGDPYGVLTKPLGPQKMFYDEFVGDMDLSGTKIIGTANNINDIPGYILNRFEDNIFYIEAYTAEEKYEIAKNYLVPNMLKKNGIQPEELKFTDEALRYIAKECCTDEGARDMSGYVHQLMRKVVADWSKGGIEKPFVVDVDYVKSRLVKKMETTGRKIGLV